jgi:hypothetical protein
MTPPHNEQKSARRLGFLGSQQYIRKQHRAVGLEPVGSGLLWAEGERTGGITDIKQFISK